MPRLSASFRLIASLFVAVAALTTFSQSLPAAPGEVSHPRKAVRPDSSPTSLIGSTTGPMYLVKNTGSTAWDTYGVEGLVTNAAAGIGVLGSGNNAGIAQIGVYGSVLGPNSTAVYAFAQATANPLSTPSSGIVSDAVQGVSYGGPGVVGETTWPNESQIGQIAAVMGMDESVSGDSNDGVIGMTNNGGYGVDGISYGGALGGVRGSAVDAYGVTGESGTGAGVFGFSASGAGLVGQSASFPLLLYAVNGEKAVLSVDEGGNLIAAGSVTPSGSPGSIIKTRHAFTEMYSVEAATRTVEDVGTGQMVAGVGRVVLDPALVDALDENGYHIFLTPKGDCHGLYVTQETPQSFVVRELQGGRSSISFDYRIVAQPLEGKGERMHLARSRDELLRSLSLASLPSRLIDAQKRKKGRIRLGPGRPVVPRPHPLTTKTLRP